ncbi:NTP transferase domain-containing protein [Actinokineospora guangxiensis]|uniref:NTP transferase domain-containing protein n=1 Tax=Actinokineospora guangxiensis TaxID=1490288 RepID=A0ABW0ENN8_9PSEU
MTWAAIVLAGGRGSRLGGLDKPALAIGGATLLDRAVEAAAGAGRVVVVGPERPCSRPVTWTREAEPGSGPVAAVAAGLAVVGAVEVVVLLAADLPAVTSDAVALVRAAALPAGAVLVDGDGRDQWLLSAWPAAALRAAFAAPGRGLHATLGPLGPARVADVAGASADVDTPEDLARWR